MQPLESIDIRFKVNTSIDKEDICFYSVLQKPFSVHGLIYENGQFRRMPEAVAKSVSPGVHWLHTNTSGGRVRFKTNSSYIAIFPLYSEVCELYIGLQKDAVVDEATPYKMQKPVVFYGNSVTQGGCASRPGNSYPNILSRWFDFDFVNLGFSGNGKGEQIIVDYMADLDMSMFIMDYDHNSPSVEHLQETHPNMYKAIRKAHPEIPIIMMSAISLPWSLKRHYDRRDVIRKTYENAVSAGDKNVYFWDGTENFAPYADYGTVEGDHPNDCGFYGIAESLSKILDRILPR